MIQHLAISRSHGIYDMSSGYKSVKDISSVRFIYVSVKFWFVLFETFYHKQLLFNYYRKTVNGK